MVEVPLSWKISQTGAEDVSAKFKEMKASFDIGEISQQQYTKAMKDLQKQARDLTQDVRTQRSIFQANHTALIGFSRAMSAVHSVTFAAATAMNTINIAQLAFSGTSEAVAESQLAMEKAQRAANDALKEFGKDSPQYKTAQAEMNIATQRHTDAIKAQEQAQINAGISTATSFALISSSVASSYAKFAQYIPQMVTHLRTLSAAVVTAGTSIGAITLAAATLGAAAGAIAGFFAADWLNQNTVWYHNYAIGMTNLFYKTIPKILADATAQMEGFILQAGTAFERLIIYFQGQFATDLKNAFVNAWNGAITATNAAVSGIVKGSEIIANSAIASINGIISGINAIASAAHLPTLPTIPALSLQAPQIPLIAAATGFHGEVKSPTLFLAGEAGVETVDIASGSNSVSNSNSYSSSGGVTNIYHIHGSVISEREMYKTNARYNKREILRRGGFRPTS